MRLEKILYIGTSLHLDPLVDFNLTKEFIFIDTLPRKQYNDNNIFDIKSYNKNFYSDLILYCYRLGFSLEFKVDLDKNYYKKTMTIKDRLYYMFFKKVPKHINPTLLLFYNKETEQVLKYYISTNIEYNINNNIIKDIESCDSLIMSYEPIIKIFDYIKRPISVIGYYYMSFDFYEKLDIKNKEIFNKYYYKTIDSIIEVKNISEMIEKNKCKFITTSNNY